MKEQTNNEQAFLENANEAAGKNREIYHIFGGYGSTGSPVGSGRIYGASSRPGYGNRYPYFSV